ncbi:MAG: PAS domain-containing protein, partial [Actinomycetes bacterium]
MQIDAGQRPGEPPVALAYDITVDEQHRICVFNHAACQMFRCTTAEAMGAPIEDFMPARFRDTHAAHMRSFGEDGVTTRSMGRTGKVHALRS